VEFLSRLAHEVLPNWLKLVSERRRRAPIGVLELNTTGACLSDTKINNILKSVLNTAITKHRTLRSTMQINLAGNAFDLRNHISINEIKIFRKHFSSKINLTSE